MRYKKYLAEEDRTVTLNKDIKIKGTDTVIPKGTVVTVVSSKEDVIVGEVTIKGKTIRITVPKDVIRGKEEEEEKEEEE